MMLVYLPKITTRLNFYDLIENTSLIGYFI